mmetsp:Transcript_42930/g.68944  ORF Transcript_42930/g.68944 Transcript_42930/m.68944 type:complete len:229 (-) Transcript_42930:821-1507(-)
MLRLRCRSARGASSSYTCKHERDSVEKEAPLSLPRPTNFPMALFGRSSNSREILYAAGPGLVMHTAVASRVLLPKGAPLLLPAIMPEPLLVTDDASYMGPGESLPCTSTICSALKNCLAHTLRSIVVLCALPADGLLDKTCAPMELPVLYAPGPGFSGFQNPSVECGRNLRSFVNPMVRVLLPYEVCRLPPMKDAPLLVSRPTCTAGPGLPRPSLSPPCWREMKTGSP